MNLFARSLFLATLSMCTTLQSNSIAHFIEHKYCAERFSQNCCRVCANSCTTFSCGKRDVETSAVVNAIKALNGFPIDPVKDFPENIDSFTDQERADYRTEFTRNLACVLGSPVGWKLALGNASPTNPVLGYTQPAIGQLLDKMIICELAPTVNNKYASLPIVEVDLFVRVKDAAINQATTPEELIAHLESIFPGFELAAGYTSSLTDLAGPELGGNSLIPLLNGAARLAVLGEAIPISSQSSTAWVALLSGALTGTEEIMRTTGPGTTRTFGSVNFIELLQVLLMKLQENGISVQKGDILSLGNLTGVNLYEGNEVRFEATYDNLNPDGPLTVSVQFSTDTGLCIGNAGSCS